MRSLSKQLKHSYQIYMLKSQLSQLFEDGDNLTEEEELRVRIDMLNILYKMRVINDKIKNINKNLNENG